MDKKILGIWAHPYNDFKPENLPGQVESLFKTFADSGISYYMPFLAEDGKAFYQSKILKAQQDYLSVILDKAPKFGIKVNPLVGFGRLSSLAQSHGYTYQAVVPAGVDAPYPVGRAVCASWKQNRETLLGIVSELVDNYPLAGIQLDYFRYPNMTMLAQYPCECKACSERRLSWLGHEKLTPEDLKNPAVMAKEIAQRTENVYGTLQAISPKVRSKGMLLSLAARARYHQDALYEGQDWHKWIHEGYFDLVFPMSYNQCKDRFARFLQEHSFLTKNAKASWIAGVGKKSSLSNLTTEDFVNQIKTALDKGVAGICIYSHTGMTPADYEALKTVRNHFA